MIIVNFHELLMNESWSDPEEFRPERFIDKNDRISVPEQYLPFSIGMFISIIRSKNTIEKHKIQKYIYNCNRSTSLYGRDTSKK